MAFSQLAFKLSFTKYDFLVRPSNCAPVLSQAMKTAWTPQIIKDAFARTGTLRYVMKHTFKNN
jgi:hypothetical protein